MNFVLEKHEKLCFDDISNVGNLINEMAFQANGAKILRKVLE